MSCDSLHLESDHSDVDQSWKYSAQRLPGHHPAHVLGGKLPRHADEAALEDGRADVEKDDYEKCGGEEPFLPQVGVYPGHDQDRNEESGHHRQGPHDPHVQPKVLAVDDVENNKDSVGNVGGDGQV